LPGKLTAGLIEKLKTKGLEFIKAHTKKVVKTVPTGGGGNGGYTGPVGAGAAGIRKLASSFHPSYIAGHRDPQGGPAFDIGSSGAKNRNIGNALRANHGKLGLRYVIRQMQITSARNGWKGWRRYSPITNAGDWAHVNHVHVSYARGTQGASRNGLALVGEKGPELLNMKAGQSILSTPQTQNVLSEAVSTTMTRAFAQGMSAATSGLEHSVATGLGAAMRRAANRQADTPQGDRVGYTSARNSTRTVVIQNASFPNVKNGDDAEAFLDNLFNVS